MAYDKQADCACYIYCLKEIPRSFDRGVVFRRLFGTLLSSQGTGAHHNKDLLGPQEVGRLAKVTGS